MENLQQQQEMQNPPSTEDNPPLAPLDPPMNNRNQCNRFANILGGNVKEFDGDLCEVSRMRHFGVTINGRPSKAALDMDFSYESMDRQGRTLNLAEVMLRQDEVKSFMNAVTGQGLNVTALHNHHVTDNPRLFYMHVNSVEEPAAFAQKMQRAMNNF
jgi:hypothetical protein